MERLDARHGSSRPIDSVRGEAAPTRALYEQLQPRRNGLAREEVARHQRARLHGATVQAVCERGLAATSVADLIALAGVSRRAFYEHFASKEDCFLSSYEQIVTAAAQRIMTAYSRPSSDLERIQSAWAAFVAELVERPKESHLVIVDVLAAGPNALERVERARIAFESGMLSNPAPMLAGMTLSPALVKGITSGFWQVARRRLLNDRLKELPALGGELLMWALSYNSPAAEQLVRPDQAEAPCSHSPALRREQPPSPALSNGDERKRMARAAAELAAHHGYEALTPALIIEHAGVTYECFFDRFRSAEECFLAGLELLAVEALASASKHAHGAPDWPGAVQRGIRALFGQIAADPIFARVAFVEVFATGPVGIGAREQILERTAALFARDAKGPQPLSGVVAEAIIGAVWGLAYGKVVGGEAQQLPELTEHASYLALAPVLGAEQAVERILATRAERRSAIQASSD